MLKNNLILRYITVTNSQTKEVIRPQALEELGYLKKHLWLWSGAMDRLGRPVYQNRMAIRVLYDHFKCNLRREWRLRYPEKHNWRNVNPYSVSVANGYNFDRGQENVEDLIDLITEYNLSNKLPREIYELFDKLYIISDIEKALKAIRFNEP